MGQTQASNYQTAGQTVDRAEAEKRLDTPERQLAAAQVDATLAVVDQLALLTSQVSRLVDALEALQGLPDQVNNAAHLLRDQIRASAGS